MVTMSVVKPLDVHVNGMSMADVEAFFASVTGAARRTAGKVLIPARNVVIDREDGMA